MVNHDLRGAHGNPNDWTPERLVERLRTELDSTSWQRLERVAHRLGVTVEELFEWVMSEAP